jgi:multiple sugar transport system ATP-binding protein
MAELRLEGLVKRYGRVEALNGLDLDVHDGEFFALLGPSAAGKTTTMRVIAGLERPEAGRVIFAGRELNDIPVRRRDMAMVFQSFALYPHLTTYDNLAYPLRESGLPRRAIAKAVHETAELLRISHTLKRKPASLSGGEQQRLAIGRAIIRKPKLFLLDEPLTNLDAKLRHEMRAEFKRLHRELKATMLFATPDQLEALTMGERIGVLRAGKIVQIATPEELYMAPGDTFVARIVGDPPINLVPAILRRGGSALTLELPFLKLDGAPFAASLSAFADGTEFHFGIRPQDLSLRVGTARDFSFGAEIAVTEPQGDITILDLKADSSRLRLVLPEAEAAGFGPGDRLEVALDPRAGRLFLKDSGLAVA